MTLDAVAAPSSCRAPTAARTTPRVTAGLCGTVLTFVLGFGLALMPHPTEAQARADLPRVGMLYFGSAPPGPSSDPERGPLQGLKDLGYGEGQNILIDRRYADGRANRLEELATEMVKSNPVVIVAHGPGPREAARRATRSIPIVAVGSDPVREGWAQSLAHPGGNVTGMTVTFPELGGKRMEILKQALPALTRVAVLFNPRELSDAQAVVEGTRAAAEQLGLQVQMIEVHGPQDFEAAFAAARRQRAQALHVIATNTFVSYRAQLARLAIGAGLPSISDFPLLAQAGLLMTYGADLDDLGRRMIVYMDKILKGARPADLPIERPVKLQLSVNLGTAKALGIKLPQSLLWRADEVIE
jgi:putative ABC transport system substrate-binding protein